MRLVVTSLILLATSFVISTVACRSLSDTDNVFSQDGTSEGIIGEWMELRGVRDQMVIATKVTSSPVSLRIALTD